MTTRLQSLTDWVNEVAALTQPDKVYWCDGSEREYRTLVDQMIGDGTLIALNQEHYPGCYLHRSDPDDVARVEHLTYVCTRNKVDAGPEQQLAGPGRGEGDHAVVLQRRDARQDDVRHPVLHGSARLAVRTLRRRDHRQPLRRRQHVLDDADRQTRARAHRARSKVRQRPALDRRARSGSAATSCTSPRSSRS